MSRNCSLNEFLFNQKKKMEAKVFMLGKCEKQVIGRENQVVIDYVQKHRKTWKDADVISMGDFKNGEFICDKKLILSTNRPEIERTFDEKVDRINHMYQISTIDEDGKITPSPSVDEEVFSQRDLAPLKDINNRADLMELANIEVAFILQEFGVIFDDSFDPEKMKKCVLYRNLELESALRKIGCTENNQQQCEYTGFIYSIYQYTDKFRDFLKSHLVDINQFDKYGYTPLMKGTYDVMPNIIEMMISLGADLNLQNPENGDTAMMVWAKGYLPPMFFNPMIKAGADFSIRNNDGQSLMDIVRATENDALLQYLISQNVQ